MSTTLFKPRYVGDFARQLRESMLREIEALPPDRIAGLDPDLFGREVAAKYTLVTPVLGSDITYDAPPFSPRPEVAVTLHIPYTGNKDLWSCHGQTHPLISLNFTASSSSLTVSLPMPRSQIGTLPERVAQLRKEIQQGLDSIEQYVKHFNVEIRDQAVAHTKQRQEEVRRHHGTLSDLRSTGFSLRGVDNPSMSIVTPVVRKAIAVQPSATSGGEPELSLLDYDKVLQVVRDMVKVFERSPSVFKTMGEEDLRTILLVALNGVFEGAATGETFNGAGRTDILIRVQNANIFLAECLIWDGQEHFRKKLEDQLLPYTTWRDTKLAALVFNRKKNFSAVLDKMNGVVGSLKGVVAPMPYPADVGCRYRLRRDDDQGKEFILTCLAFEVPT